MNVVIINAWQMVLKGGPMIWPLLLLSITAMAIAINRIIFMQQEEKKFTQQREMLLESLRKGDLKETLKSCEASQGITATLIKSAILNASDSAELMKLSMQEAWAYEQIAVKNFMPLLAMITNIAPLLGLLGTVSSMTVLFHASVVRSNILNPVAAGELAAGIWQALISTTAGLIVGICAYIVYCFCSNRMQVYALKIDHLIAETVRVVVSLRESHQTGFNEHER